MSKFVYPTERNSELDLCLAEEFDISIDELDTIAIEIVEKMRVWMNNKPGVAKEINHMLDLE